MLFFCFFSAACMVLTGCTVANAGDENGVNDPAFGKRLAQRFIDSMQSAGEAADAAVTAADAIKLIAPLHERLSNVNPAADTDEDGGHAACVRHAVHHIDERLHAENDFLDSCNTLEVQERLQHIAATHHEALRTQIQGKESDAPAALLEIESDVDLPCAKALEAWFLLRFLCTRQHKLQVLHYLSAIVSLHVQLLRDEDAEMPWTDTERPAACTFTSPFAGPSTTTDLTTALRTICTTGATADAPACLRPPDLDNSFQETWSDDRVCGVCVRDVTGQRVLHAKALQLFEMLEREALRTATYFMEKRAAALEAEGSKEDGTLLDRLDIMQVTFC
jgi:hypothetical protein